MSKIDGQFDASPREKRLVEERAKLRQALKKEYLRKFTDPHHQEGHIFDPAMQRYYSMHMTVTERFIPTWKGFGMFLGISVLPVVLYAWYLTASYTEYDRKCRTGEIKYEDRRFKFS